MTRSVLDRVLARVTVTPSGCWEFDGCRLDRGYGRTSWHGRLWLTHRLVYTLMVGEIPAGLEIDHLCKNKPCCNPAHLEPVTRSENLRRGTQWHHTAARELAKTHCREGHPYDLLNTYWTPRGHRQCRICKRAALDRYTERNRDLLAARQRAIRARKKAAA